MEPLITAAARALEAGDPFGAVGSVALRDDAPVLALRRIAIVQHGHFAERDPMSARSGVGHDQPIKALPMTCPLCGLLADTLNRTVSIPVHFA